MFAAICNPVCCPNCRSLPQALPRSYLKGHPSKFRGCIRNTRQRLAAVAKASTDKHSGNEKGTPGFFQRLFPLVTGFPFPLGPILVRQTLRHEVIKNTIWTFEQEQTLSFTNVATVVRMTVIKLQSGGLFIYSPIAPTSECMQLLQDLDAPVEHIVLATHAYEHKVFVPPFQRRFPYAQVYVTPRQWSLPLNLPLPLLGIFNAKQLTNGDTSQPWADELEFNSFAEYIGIAPYCETAFFHKPTRTLLVTDAVVYIPNKPPEIIDRAKLMRAGKDNLFVKLFFAKDKPQHPKSEEEQQIIGWHRMTLLVLYFSPNQLRDPSNFGVVRDQLVVAPVVQTLVFSKVPAAVRQWVDEIVGQWKFKRIISAHFGGPVNATPQDFRRAFSFAYAMEELGVSKKEQVDNTRKQAGEPSLLSGALGEWPEAMKSSSVRYPEADLRALQSIDSFIKLLGGVFRQPRN